MAESTEPTKPVDKELKGRIGKYEILRPLGKGAMGQVYLAHDTTLDRDVALKVVVAQIADDPELTARDVKGRKPSERLFRHAAEQLQARGIDPGQVLHVGSRLVQDVAPAKRLGMKTALFAGDKASLQASGEQLKENAYRPDVLLTELGQIAEVVA